MIKKYLQQMKAMVLVESSTYFIFASGSLYSSDVYRLESGRCHTLSFFLTFLITNKVKEHKETLKCFDTQRGLCQPEVNESM